MSGSFQGIMIHTEPVVLGGDFHFACFQIFDRLVTAPVAELQFKGFPPQCQAQQLMSQADAENGPSANLFGYGLNGVGNRRWVSWAVAQEEAVRVEVVDNI